MIPLFCLLLLACIPVDAEAQDASAFVGDWRLVSVLQPDSAGRTRPFWGPKPLGMIRYSANGVMAAQLYDERRPGLGVGNWGDVSPEAARTALVGLASYYGTFTVDTVRRTIAHRVEGAMAPEWIGRTLVRGYRFLPGDCVELRVITGADGTPTTTGQVLVWERIPPTRRASVAMAAATTPVCSRLP
ncbi:lipocalin-like domain-containing protein [Gemmatimonas sp.]|uniref:lipocalin-like domain-containing protein n=1 Tax=Gemmatimonas sp. TaxID=1962908 RepID=UPI0039830987